MVRAAPRCPERRQEGRALNARGDLTRAAGGGFSHSGAVSIYGPSVLFDPDRNGRAIKVAAVLLAAVFLIGMFVLGGVLIFT